MMPDVQSEPDTRNVVLDAVGITGLRYPVTFVDGQLTQQGIADIEITVQLPAERRGTHMSRMVEIVDQCLTSFNPHDLARTMKHTAQRLEAEHVELRIAMPFVVAVVAPVTRTPSWQTMDMEISAQYSSGLLTVDTKVRADVTTLCPCSKAVSDYGAHNQRSHVDVAVVGSGDSPYPISVLDLAELARNCGSSPMVPLLKRPDERAVTMEAYDHPAFVEDVARDLSTALRRRSVSHRIEVRSIESIHSHDALARTLWAC